MEREHGGGGHTRGGVLNSTTDVVGERDIERK
jgi:hypothetical protein